ncbi:MAG: V-type ATP synthase subunit F [Candidatus Bathyarchaeia archaeon]
MPRCIDLAPYAREGLDIVAIGDCYLIRGLRLAGLRRCHEFEPTEEGIEGMRRTLKGALEDPGVGIIILLEDYARYVSDILGEVAKRGLPVVLEVPSKLGARRPDVKSFYRSYIRKLIGFEVEI